MTKTDMMKEIKALRKQMYNLKKQAEEREEKLFAVLMAFEPFMGALTKAAETEIRTKLGIE